MCRYPQRPTEDIRSSFRNEVTEDCELADMGAGNPGCLQEQHAPGTSESSPSSVITGVRLTKAH